MKYYQITILLFLGVLIGACSLLGGDDEKEHDPYDPPCIWCGPQYQLIDTEPAWSPDGATIAFNSYDSSGNSGIYFVDSDGANRRLFHQGFSTSSLSWSPDGQWLTFSQGAQIFKKQLATDSLVQLTSQGRNFFPDWSPDGAWIAYNQSICNEIKACGIWMVNLLTLEEEFIAEYGNYPDWHPIGNKILYRKSRSENGYVLGNELWVFDTNSKNEELFTFLSTPDHFSLRYPKYSPDGHYIIFASQPTGGFRQVWVMDVNSLESQQLTESGATTPNWSPDGEWIVYTNYDTGRLWLMRPDGTDKQQLTYDE